MNGIVHDGDFRRIRQEHFPVSPDPPEQIQAQKRRIRKQGHPWKSPAERYHNKQLNNSIVDDDDLEELSWKHRSKAYDLTRSDVIKNRVVHWNSKDDIDDQIDNEINYSKGFRKNTLPSKESSQHYTDRRPKSIETTTLSKTDDEQVITPATVPMDEDEFDSPCCGCTPSSSTFIESLPAVITPPKAILAQLAMDKNEVRTRNKGSSLSEEGTEITLKMFEDDKRASAKAWTDDDMEEMEGAVKKILERRSGVQKLIEEHERLMAETQKKISVTPDSGAKSDLMAFRKSKKLLKEHHKTEMDCNEGKDEADLASEEPMIILNFKDEDDEKGTFLPRSSILTTIVEESTPLKRTSPPLESPDFFRAVRAVNVDTRKEFKEKRITKLNKVTIAAALIEFHESVMDERKPVYEEKISNDTRLTQAIKKHRKQNGFFTGATPTQASLKNNAAMTIQASWRTFQAIRLARRKIDIARNFAATLIQAQWRVYDSRMNYKWHRGSAAILQGKWRGFICRKQFESMRSSALLVQSIARRHLGRTKYLECKGAAIIAQTQWRSYIYQKHYLSMRSSTIVVQSVARMNSYRNKFVKLKASAISIQACSRMFLCHSRYTGCKNGVTKLQAVFRKYICRGKYLAQKAAATTLQSALRRHISRSNFVKCKRAVINLQSLSRTYLCHSKYVQSKRAIVKLQAAMRMNSCRSTYAEYKKSAVALQSLSRMWISRATYFKQKRASTTLQSALRMNQCRSNYVQLQRSITVLQAKSRVFLCRTKYLKQQRAAITLQGVVRMHLSRTRYIVLQYAALVVQAAVREYMRKKDYATFEALREVQAKWRSSVCRNDYAALVEIKEIPTSRRTSICKRNFIYHLSSSIIQTGWRGYTHRKAFEAARRIQASWRGSLCRKNLILRRLSANRLQQNWRSYYCRKNYTVMLASARLLQSKYRAYIQKKNYLVTLESITKVQSQWRSYLCEKHYLFSLHSAIKVQSSFRAYACRKSYARLLCNRAATKLESIARMHLCRSKFVQFKASRAIQAAARMHLCRAKFLSCHNAIVIIQANFRAYACRKEFALHLNAVKMVEEQKSSRGYAEEENVGGSPPVNEQALSENIVLAEDGTMYIEDSDRSSILTIMDSEDSEIDEEDEGMFLGRSSTLTTIVEERSSLSFASPPLESPERQDYNNDGQCENDSKSLNYPSTIKKKQLDVAIEENLPPTIRKNKDDSIVEENLETVKVEVKNDRALSSGRSGEIEDRRASEERLLALAAKVAERRASLNRRRLGRLDSTTRDPWQKKIELQKKSKPVMLSKRMGELEKLSKQKRVSGSIWNLKEEKITQAADTIDDAPLVKYPNIIGNRDVEESGDIDNRDSVVKKLFQFDGYDHVVASDTNLVVNASGNRLVETQEIEFVGNGNSDFIDMDGKDSVSGRARFSEDLVADDLSFETNVNEEQVVSNEILDSDVNNYDEYEHSDGIRSWERRSIVDDLADDIYDFETDSDNDDSSFSFDDMERKSVNYLTVDTHASDVTTFDEGQVDDHSSDIRREEGSATRPTLKVWSIVDDLIDDVDGQLDDISDTEDDVHSDENGNGEKNKVSIPSPVGVMNLFQKGHQLWNISGEDVSETVISSLYTVAETAASMIGIAE